MLGVLVSHLLMFYFLLFIFYLIFFFVEDIFKSLKSYPPIPLPKYQIKAMAFNEFYWTKQLKKKLNNKL